MGDAVREVVIVDYGMGNLDSVARAVEECRATPVVVDDPARLRTAALLILPGVGAFADGMRNLADRGFDKALRHHVLEERIPILGICLGMQLMADRGVEGGVSPGLGLLRARTEALRPSDPALRLPHIGWNEVHHQGAPSLFEGIPSGKDFYFVHGYHVVPEEPGIVIARTPYGGDFVSAVQKGNIAGTQFHPEKSQDAGLRLLRNFIHRTG